jgi:hypothetical protein
LHTWETTVMRVLIQRSFFVRIYRNSVSSLKDTPQTPKVSWENGTRILKCDTIMHTSIGKIVVALDVRLVRHGCCLDEGRCWWKLWFWNVKLNSLEQRCSHLWTVIENKKANAKIILKIDRKRVESLLNLLYLLLFLSLCKWFHQSQNYPCHEAP